MQVFYPIFQKEHVPPFEVSGSIRRRYNEIPKRLEIIIDAIKKQEDKYTLVPIASITPDNLARVHSSELISFFSSMKKSLKRKDIVVPDAFPVREFTLPSSLQFRAGYFCFDAATPIRKDTVKAALNAASASLKAADHVLSTGENAFALVRPPGHHAGRDYFGGYCYINNAALAAERFSKHGKVAILDIDYYHGNGTQDIFYSSDKVLYMSVHRDPDVEFPFFWGYQEEKGKGKGEGWNVNVPLKGSVTGKLYLEVVKKLIALANKKKAKYLVVSFGSDIHKDDPLGTFKLVDGDFAKIGKLLKQLNMPTLIILEGGFNAAVLKNSTLNFLEAFNG